MSTLRALAHFRSRWLVALVVVALSCGAAMAARSHGSTRPGGGGGSSGGVATRPSGGGASGGGGTVHASGSATYGHGGGRYGGYHGGWYGGGWYGGWYGWPYGWSAWWGWPVYGWYPIGSPYGPVVVDSGGRADLSGVPGQVETAVRPKRAEVRLDGAFVGQARDYNGTWDALAVAPGPHEIEFSKDGYMTLTVYADVPPAGRWIIDQRLARGEGSDPRSTFAPPESAERPEPSTPSRTSFEVGERAAPPAAGALRTALLRIDAVPADAAVYLDGEFLARADELARLHGAIPVAEGEHTIEVVRPGYGSDRRQVDVSGSEPVTVEVRLQRANGR